MPLYMLHRSMLLGKLLALDLPLEQSTRVVFIRLSIMKVCLWLMALYLPLSAGAYLDKLQDQRLDQWLKLLLLQRFSCDCFSSRVNSVRSHWISIPIFSYHL